MHRAILAALHRPSHCLQVNANHQARRVLWLSQPGKRAASMQSGLSRRQILTIGRVFPMGTFLAEKTSNWTPIADSHTTHLVTIANSSEKPKDSYVTYGIGGLFAPLPMNRCSTSARTTRTSTGRKGVYWPPCLCLDSGRDAATLPDPNHARGAWVLCVNRPHGRKMGTLPSVWRGARSPFKAPYLSLALSTGSS